MSTAADDLLRRALELTDAERAELASALLDSLTPEVPAEARSESQWLAEIERRVAAAKAGEPGILWDELRKQLDDRLARARRG